MPVQMGMFIHDGPSCHRLRKGLLLVSNDRTREPSRIEGQRIVERAQRLIQQYARTEHERLHHIEQDEQHPALLMITTPWSHIHSQDHRHLFFYSLSRILFMLSKAAEVDSFFVVGTGINPFVGPLPGAYPALCADIHEIQVFDDLEVSRIYNLFRQYLPELLALSSHSAFYGGRLQKDLSTRMRLNPASFIPPPLKIFSTQQIERLRNFMQRRHGVSDLRQLDVNPLPNTYISLRFVDAQCSLPFIRSQLVLFQAIAIHGRALARQGSRIPTRQHWFISQNKARAIESGPSALFKPVSPRGQAELQEDGPHQFAPQRASTVLLDALEARTLDKDPKTILHALRSLNVTYEELAPWLLGAELRKQGIASLVNYGEQQKYLFHIAQQDWKAQLQAQFQQLIRQPSLDLILEYNRSQHTMLADEIASTWRQKLAPLRSEAMLVQQ